MQVVFSTPCVDLTGPVVGKVADEDYIGSYPVMFVSKFKAIARNFVVAFSGLQSPTIFKLPVKNKASNWHHLVSSKARYRLWKT